MPRTRGSARVGTAAIAELDEQDLAAPSEIIANADREWGDWNRLGMAFFAASGGSDAGFAADHVVPSFFGLYLDGNLVASGTAANTATSTAWSIYRWGWGFSTSQDFNGDIALIAFFASSWTPAMVRRWHADPFGFLRPWNEVPAVIESPPPAMPPSTGTGVVTFLMG